jgi:hypothetical protein
MKKPEKIRLFAFALLSFLDFERTHTARSLFFSPAPFFEP